MNPLALWLNFLAPWWVPVLAGGLTVPPLVLLYFLKLKRREMPIASTLLWRRAVQDLQVNSPFQRLRSNLLLFLQLLILLLAILAISEPIWAGNRGVEKAIVLLLDQSASMAATESGGKTRLAIAREEARRVIGDMSTSQKAMVIAFASRARVLTSFTDDKDALRRAVDSVQQTDEPGRLKEAMLLAEAHSTPIGEDIGTKTEVAMSQYIVFTDGRVPDAEQIVVKRGSLDVVRVGQATDNVGIVNLDVRRNYERPEQLSVLARVHNFGGQKVSRDVSLFVDGDLKGVQTREIAPLGSPDRLGRLNASQSSEESAVAVPFELTLPTAAQIEVRLSGQDALATDDRAYAIVAPPRPMSALLVTPGNRFLRQLLRSLPLDHHDVWTPEEYESKPDKELIQDGRCRYDVVVLDGHRTRRLPPGNYLLFASVPLIPGVDTGASVEGQVFLDWDETHPILRHVSVEAINVLSWLDLKLPPEAVTLIDGSNGPVLSLLRRERNQYLICAFGLFDEKRASLNTDWVFQESFVAFGYNALRYLTGSSTIGQQPPVAPGEAFTVAVKPGTSTVTIRRPDGESDKVPVQSSGLLTYGQTNRVGVYHVTPGAAGDEARAVNLVDQDESFIAPKEDFQIAAGQMTTSKGIDRVNRPLWPYLLAALGAVLFFEWFVYNKRVFI